MTRKKWFEYRHVPLISGLFFALIFLFFAVLSYVQRREHYSLDSILKRGALRVAYIDTNYRETFNADSTHPLQLFAQAHHVKLIAYNVANMAQMMLLLDEKYIDLAQTYVSDDDRPDDAYRTLGYGPHVNLYIITARENPLVALDNPCPKKLTLNCGRQSYFWFREMIQKYSIEIEDSVCPLDRLIDNVLIGQTQMTLVTQDYYEKLSFEKQNELRILHIFKTPMQKGWISSVQSDDLMNALETLVNRLKKEKRL